MERECPRATALPETGTHPVRSKGDVRGAGQQSGDVEEKLEITAETSHVAPAHCFEMLRFPGGRCLRLVHGYRMVAVRDAGAGILAHEPAHTLVRGNVSASRVRWINEAVASIFSRSAGAARCRSFRQCRPPSSWRILGAHEDHMSSMRDSSDTSCRCVASGDMSVQRWAEAFWDDPAIYRMSHVVKIWF